MKQVVYPVQEHVHTILGVEGRMHTVHAPQEVRGRMVHRNQRWVSYPRPVSGYGTNGSMNVEIRFDDECKNGHQSFAITANVYTDESRRRRGDIAAGGCMHDEIAKTFPELAVLIKYHLVTTDSPLHYVANTLYHAGDRDHNGKRKGEPTSFDTRLKIGNFPILFQKPIAFVKWLVAARDHKAQTLKNKPHRRELEIVEVPYVGNGYSFEPKYSFDDFTDKWHECPFDTRLEAQQFKEALALGFEVIKTATAFSDGKERDFAAARNTACWPEATDEQLSLPREELAKLLEARLPMVVDNLRTCMEAIGFLWEPEQAVKEVA